MDRLKFWGLFLLFGILLGILLNGCGTTSGKRPPVIFPPGVDSLVAIRSDSLIDSLFVGPKSQLKAQDLTGQGKMKVDRSDSLWNLIEAKRDSHQTIPAETQKRSAESRQEGTQRIKSAISKFQNMPTDSVSRQIIQTEIYKLLEEAQRLFEQALVDNPFDEETKTWLAKVYQLMATRFQENKKYEQGIDVLKGLIRMNRGEPVLYFKLGMHYYFLKRWADAYQNFKQAEKVLLAVTPLDIRDIPTDSAGLIQKMKSVPVDTAKLFNYVFFQADTKAKLYEADTALVLLNRAFSLATSEKEKKDIVTYVGWIKWDDGNIRASELKDLYQEMQNNENYEAAAEGFRKLVDVLKTERTKSQINWQISFLEFMHLNQHEKGIERLSQVIRMTEKDSLGAPKDTTYKQYFKDYGTMCYNMGVKHVSNMPRVAFMYFMQAVTIDCPIRGKSYLELAKLSVNNPQKAIEMCHHALVFANQLSTNEKIQAYRLLVEGYKRKGEIEKAKEYFVKWKLLDAKAKDEENREQNHG